MFVYCIQLGSLVSMPPPHKSNEVKFDMVDARKSCRPLGDVHSDKGASFENKLSSSSIAVFVCHACINCRQVVYQRERRQIARLLGRKMTSSWSPLVIIREKILDSFRVSTSILVLFPIEGESCLCLHTVLIP